MLANKSILAYPLLFVVASAKCHGKGAKVDKNIGYAHLKEGGSDGTITNVDIHGMPRPEVHDCEFGGLTTKGKWKYDVQALVGTCMDADYIQRHAYTIAPLAGSNPNGWQEGHIPRAGKREQREKNETEAQK
ncbi:hypothetical protein P154DRAFT_614588 [Amniculicola lignicola CBS 123094]|uniref:Uncharacterized protein n=1 Tax=Amniculicola lignicola CBS 123094 TaxID=1392246 RepID=A0A6A5X5K6_9PLEO|nr:hypothetical protein P154DRAFT_614588 [Amniculicola lignicola CBS 123094]